MRTWIPTVALLLALPAWAGPCDKPTDKPSQDAVEPCADTESPPADPSSVPAAPLLTLTGSLYEDDHWSTAVTWHWPWCSRIEPTLTYLYLDDQYAGLSVPASGEDYRSYRPAPSPPPMPLFDSGGVWGLGVSIDVGRKRRQK